MLISVMRIKQHVLFLQGICLQYWNTAPTVTFSNEGNLRDYLRSKRPTEENKEIGLDRSEILRIYSQVSDGLSFLASKNVRKDFMFIVDTSKIILS